MVFTAVFLFNLMCAMVPCDPYYSSPNTPPLPDIEGGGGGGGTVRRSFKRSGDSDNDLSGFDERLEPIVFTKSGALQGYFMTTIEGRQIYSFEGIRYGESPTGINRFRDPIPVKPWSGLRSALKPGSECTQIHLAKLGRVLGREDCLFLNIYTPQIGTARKHPNLPVIIYLHGGGFVFGSGHEYGPSYLLAKEDVILVTLNYRLGPLGFLSTGDLENPGNWGLKDQRLAIKWISDNIYAFGGNASRITLMGQSAGGVSVHLHIMSNGTKHLVNNAIAVSASAFVHWATFTKHQAGKWAQKFARVMRCPSNRGSKVMMDCLRSRDPNFIVAKQGDLFDFIGLPPIAFRPSIEPQHPQAIISESPAKLYETGQVAKIPFLCTSTKEEAEFFVLILKGVGIYRLLLNHWQVAAPSIYDYRRVAGNVTEVTQRIVEFYLNGTNPREAPASVFSDVGTDRYFTLGIRKALRAHSKIAPTYSYIFGFKSQVGIATAFWGQPFVEFGVPHGEDLTYTFNSTLFWPSIKRRDSAYAITKLMVSLFSNFAATSEPLYTDEDGKKIHIWDKIEDSSDLKFLQIDTDVKMIPEPFTERLRFWEQLNINDERAYDFA